MFFFVFFGFVSIPVASASSYQKIAPGGTVTLGELVFDDYFVATTTDCRVGITNPLNVEVVPSTTAMTANADGWHYYNYTTAGNAPSGTWPSVMICGTTQAGDLVIVDKSFIVDWSVVSTSTIKEVVDESLAIATSSLAAVINANTNSTVLTASTSLATALQTASSSIVTQILSSMQTASSSIVSQIISSITSVPSLVWAYSTRTLTSLGTLAADVWTSTTRTLTGAGLDSGSLATLSDVQTATSSLASAITTASSSIASFVNANTNSQVSGITSAVNANTDAQLLAASTSLASFINNNSNLTILAASTSLASYLSTHTDAASSSIASFVNANTNSTMLAASTSLAAFINAHTDSQVSGIASSVNANTDAKILTASTSLATSIPTNVWNATTRSLTTFGSLVADVATAVWTAGTRTLTSLGTLAADVWTNTTRTLTGAGLDSGSLATLSDIQTATSSVAAVVNANTNAQILTASSSLAAVINANTNTQTSGITSAVNANTDARILVATSSLASVINAHTDTELAKGWTVTLSDFGETTVNTAYKAKLQVLNYATIPTDASSLPTVVITDPAGTVQVTDAVMTKDSNGTYSYSYSIGGSAVGGVWETVVSVVINGETVKVNDYWSLSSSPADVQIVEITDKVIPTITANVRIDNMGTSASDFYYVYCIVSSESNLCGGSDDIDSGSDTAYITAGNFINLSLTLDEVPTAGTYWFKVKARALAETNWAASTEQFIAESGVVPPVTPPATPPSSGGGGGGGGGGTAVITPTIVAGSSISADFNGDDKVNSIDFSILLAFWQKSAPFKNPGVDINKDGKVNSIDFSILLYQWKK